ncbi:MAG: porin [Saprospiraceae bacterium]|nr:porin [Saprospiraceae bacterium]
MKKNILSLLLTWGLAGSALFAQQPAATEPKPIDHSYKPMTLKLNDDGSKYIRFITWHQFWMSNTQNNPGTLDINGKAVSSTMDFALRRSRFLVMSQISPRALILMHWGINNQSFVNGGSAGTTGSNGGKKPQVYIHDAWTEYELVKNVLSIGAGLHYWNGISRMTNASTLNFMAVDAPIFNWATIEATDQFARQLGIYAKGQIGRFDYRFALNKPFANGAAPKDVAKNGVAVNVLNEKWAQAGYVKYMFWDKESNKLPFEVGSHLGAKKVLNLGVGFYNHPESSLHKTASDSTFQNQTALGADVYMEYPINKTKGTMLHLYGVYYNYDFGTNYLRNLGILNTHASVAPPGEGRTADSWAGGGNLQPTIGTGSIIYTQLGFKLPQFKNGTSFMPYATFTYKNFERLADPSTQMGLGLNYFVTGHNAKITLEYQTRPVYKLQEGGTAIQRNGSKGQLIIQTAIFL